MPQTIDLPEVFTPGEIARAAGAAEADVQALVEAGAIAALPVASRTPLIAQHEAIRAGRTLLTNAPLAGAASAGVRPALLFSGPRTRPAARVPFAISSVAHAGFVAAVVLATTMGLGRPAQTATPARLEPQMLRLVYLSLPGPGGGGGGGGLQQSKPPPAAKRKGQQRLSSPGPARRPPPDPAPLARRPPEPLPEVEPEKLPPVQAPVVTSPSDERDRAGVLEEVPPRADSRGAGTGGGVGSGDGTGVGEGDGSGLGDGTGGGTGGGPYRPGSGIEPPTLLREVRPEYSEEARRRGVEGDVLLEIVVRRDGSVGDVRVLQGLGQGLDGRAVQAVRQWRFTPARRHGTPVDVLVEVAVEFRIR